ncbi:MAG TPA: mechanosensitive ion channel domain-containing protein [Opitutaceae bacterium]|jgi:small-conductance mechanosensitive channel|nr:mechanosensitive ion channel domain-containing protein [Opitutaceae bacterium]
MGRIYGHFVGHGSSTGTRLLLIVVLAAAAHVIVKVIRHLSEWFINKSHARKTPLGFMTEKPKFITLTRLIVSSVTFAIYFFSLGLVLQEFGVDLNDYLASASVIGLAISFGSQGLIQDIVIGLTLIFWDAMEVGDMVEIAGTTIVSGRVEEIGMRFTKLINFYNQEVFVPNRTIANVSRFREGGIDAYADVQIPKGADQQKAVEIGSAVAKAMRIQFAAIILSEPLIGPVETMQGGGWSFFRIHFKVWPGQGGLIETTFRQQVVTALQELDVNYAAWQVPVTYRALADSKEI